MVSPSKLGHFCDRIRGVILYDSRSSEHHVDQLRYKQPKASAIRDFPVGCGPRDSHVVVEQPQADRNAVMGKAGNRNKRDSASLGDNVGPNLKKAKLMERPSAAKGLPIASHNGVFSVKGSQKNNPLRGFASVIRNFPLFCGSNSSRLGREGAAELVASKNWSLQVENMSSEAKRKENSPRSNQNQVDRRSVTENHAGVSMVHMGRELLDLSGPINQSMHVDCLQKPASALCQKKSLILAQKGETDKSGSTDCADKNKAKTCLLPPHKPTQNPNKRKREDDKGTLKYKKVHKDMKQLIRFDKESSHERNLELGCASNMEEKHRDLNKSIQPYCPSSSGLKVGSSRSMNMREKVRETLRLFQVVFRKLLQKEEAKRRRGLEYCRRIDYKTWRILKKKGKHVNTQKVIGNVPGVQVGDEFQFKAELNVIGLHRSMMGGIDYVREGETIFASSIVSSGGYDDELELDTVTYTGQGGNVMQAKKRPEDQKLVKGNLALANSMRFKRPVRVIVGEARASTACSLSDARGKTYFYNGLYLVEEMWQEEGPRRKLVFKFKLCRIPGQPERSLKEIMKTRTQFQEGRMVLDISKGKEKLPISVINTVDYERPPQFTYTTKMIYPDWCWPSSSKGCGCKNNCSEAKNCLCIQKNGGRVPYNHDGAIVEAKPVVYECGPHCRCPPSCYNRVSQKGIRFRLQVFKTKTTGWGVRSLDFIPSGSFICEYAGELLQEKEAEKRIGEDRYLFDIGSNSYNGRSLWSGLEGVMPKEEEEDEKKEKEKASGWCLMEVKEGERFTIDAAKHGNVGRFINHSCSPNLYAQNVVYDHWDLRMPHIMLFAAENIPPMQELTYHYNCRIGEVCDADGNIKKQDCFCGSSRCTGRIY